MGAVLYARFFVKCHAPELRLSNCYQVLDNHS
jgi:hypothetical protein